ncbi:WXG100 family type VII secretion target [Actinokineospora sp. G85]|uniref:WXG100 family type VII secretion target n=1 Tax=Actinokineospora sp. G85 TaxID=3406626 RepID=UPI003C72F5E7
MIGALLSVGRVVAHAASNSGRKPVNIGQNIDGTVPTVHEGGVKAAEVAVQTDALRGSVANISAGTLWLGAAGTGYKAQADNINRMLIQARQLIDELAGATTQTGHNYSQADQDGNQVMAKLGGMAGVQSGSPDVRA